MAAARRGALIVLPTDTVYGVGTRPDDPAATAAVFAAKERPADLTLPVLVASVERGAATGGLRRARADAWPPRAGRARSRSCSRGPTAATTFDLGGDPATIGVRVPDHPLALAVLA